MEDCLPGYLPGRSTFAVSSGIPQYPIITFEPRTTNSPTSPGPTLSPFPLMMYTSSFGIPLPTEVGLLSSSSGRMYETRLHSVTPYIE